MTKKNLVMIPIEKIQLSNRQIDLKKVADIMSAFDWRMFGVLPAYKNTAGMYVITDGNHRVSAVANLMKKGQKILIPAILLNRKEYNIVKSSDRILDVRVVNMDNPEILE